MRRAVFVTALFVGLLALTGSASAGIKPGFNFATRHLEGAYKFALQARRFDPQGCYPAPPALAKLLSQKTHDKVGVAGNTGGLRNFQEVYVLRSGTNCNQLRMALRAAGGTYLLDSRQGSIRVLGQRTKLSPGVARTLSGIVTTTRTFRMTKPDTVLRGLSLCPGGRQPLGGGMITSPPNNADGEGLYPHSFERLGAQLGWHVSVVLLDPSPESTTPRTLTVQAVCGFGVEPGAPTPHKTVFIRPGQTKTVTARCPKDQFLVSGGFQRTDFRSDGGDYVTESRAAGNKAWTATGHAYASGPGELTAIAYCARMRRPMLTQVASLPVPVPSHDSAKTTTPSCPSGTRLVTGGFSANGSTDGFFSQGTMNPNNTFSASEYGFFGPLSSLTAYGYCWPARS
jgi:hypothetical protein